MDSNDRVISSGNAYLDLLSATTTFNPMRSPSAGFLSGWSRMILSVGMSFGFPRPRMTFDLLKRSLPKKSSPRGDAPEAAIFRLRSRERLGFVDFRPALKSASFEYFKLDLSSNRLAPQS